MKSLSYHLKDCKKCRHEAFYYRELFSAKENLVELEAPKNFNENLVAAIRLREAQAQWPAPRRTPSRARRWQFAMVPPVFAAAAAAAFMIFSADSATQTEPAPVAVASSQVPGPTPATADDGETAATDAAAPRYVVYNSPRLVMSQPQVVIHQSPRSALQDHPFASQLEQLVGSGFNDPLANLLSRGRTKYVLPVVNNAKDKERFY